MGESGRMPPGRMPPGPMPPGDMTPMPTPIGSGSLLGDDPLPAHPEVDIEVRLILEAIYQRYH